MSHYQLHHSGSVIKSESIQELYQLSLYTESDWQLYHVFESSMNEDIFVDGKLIPKKLVEEIRKELKRGDSVSTIGRRHKLVYNSVKKLIKSVVQKTS